MMLRADKEQSEVEWKRSCGYHRRNLAETAMFRIKALFTEVEK
jgi:hypothetical protein